MVESMWVFTPEIHAMIDEHARMMLTHDQWSDPAWDENADDWRSIVPDRVRSIWPKFKDWQKEALFQWAQEIRDRLPAALPS